MDHLPKLIRHICPDSEVAKSLKCSRTKATSLTKYRLAKEQLEIISRKLKQTKFSLILDETTDISTEKSLALVVRFFDEGVVKDRFFGVGYTLDNLLGLAADNAAVMMGQLTGVQARFKDRLPNLFVLGCGVSFFFIYVPSAAAKKLPRSLEDFVRNIYNYFSNSSQRLSKLKKCQTFMSLKPNKLLHPNGQHLQKIDPSDPRHFIKLEDIYFGAKVELLILNGNVEVMELKKFQVEGT
ncbi:hypothetical protein NQ314_018961 [Rhamnusium bicolor]|uniref:DUF4371 domain-containing protein n=1 Tax=Rhamnusium bicolor TaxID=1586634 RepID=A0AAV8WNX6_9CUCU|nr:hypothetical protein NQ314_018961 [Rhamnusium bicolor]